MPHRQAHRRSEQRRPAMGRPRYRSPLRPARGGHRSRAIRPHAAGVSAPPGASNSVTPGTGTGTATFVTLDTTTQGNWKGVYGANGYNVINDTVAYPSYVTVTPSGQGNYVWGSTNDVRALQKVFFTDRIAATWATSGSYTIDVNFTDGAQHQ